MTTMAPPASRVITVDRVLLRDAYRRKRQPHVPGNFRTGRLLALWTAWEYVRDYYANDTARRLSNGVPSLAAESAAQWSIAEQRVDRARRRYIEAYRAGKVA